MANRPKIETPRGKLIQVHFKNGRVSCRLTWNPGFGSRRTNTFLSVQEYVDAAVLRYSRPYLPMQTGMMLQQMGYGADEADAAVQRLSEGIQGLPTTLDSVVSNAQRLTILTGNLDSAVDTTLALNNAFLASGAGSDGAARGLEQYIQALSRGKFEAEEWKTMQETMGLALNRIAESFGYAGESAQNDLYAALQNGEITFSQFNSRLIQLNSGVWSDRLCGESYGRRRRGSRFFKTKRVNRNGKPRSCSLITLATPESYPFSSWTLKPHNIR